MKRHWIIWGAILIVALFAGQVSAMTVRAEISQSDVPITEITTGVPFKVDIYMNNTDSVAVDPTRGYRLSYSMPFAFFDSSGTITTVTHVDVSGSGSTGNIEVVNGFAAYWSALWWITEFSYDGTLPDSLNFTGIGNQTSGWPFNLCEQNYLRFAFQIDDTGHFCIDSIGGRTKLFKICFSN